MTWNTEHVFHCMKDCVTHYKFTKMSKPVTESESVRYFHTEVIISTTKNKLLYYEVMTV